MRKVKIVLLGISGVGKTSIVERLVNNRYNEYPNVTLGAGFYKLNYEYPPTGESIQIDIWDTAGQERYRSLLPMYTRSASAIWIVTPIGSAPSAFNAWNHLIPDGDSKVIKVYSKADTSTGYEMLCEDTFLTSAKNNFGINELLNHSIESSIFKTIPDNILNQREVKTKCQCY